MFLYFLIKFLHIFGLVLGYGGVVFTALLSAKSIKDARFFKAVSKITPTFSFLIWVGLFLLFVSGVWLEEFWEDKGYYFINGPVNILVAKKILVLFIVFHGIYVNLYLARKMKEFAELDNPFEAPGFKKFKILGIISASTSLILWSSAVILGIWASSKLI